MSMRRMRLVPLSLRPRERLLERGPEILNLEELLCVILVTGMKTKSVSVLATQISKILRKQQRVSKEELLEQGIGPSKCAQVIAALELGRRLSSSEKMPMNSAKDIFAHSYEILHEKREMLLCFYLNAQGELLKKEIVAVGTLNRASLLPREVFGLVLELPVASIIIVHNHPSGMLEPSKEDLLFTQRMKAAGEILGIKLLDHLIVSASGWKKIPL
ncbi:MAG: DNA repair protein RadC [Candidatus Woesebacteria bacterium]